MLSSKMISRQLTTLYNRQVSQRVFNRSYLSNYKLPLYLSSEIINRFPGGSHQLANICQHSSKQTFSYRLDWIQTQIKNKLFSKAQLLEWRNNLQTLSDSDDNFILKQMIGMLTLASGEIRHMAYTPDGNRRWAALNHLSISRAHEQCFTETIPTIIQEVFQFDVHTFSLWIFKSNNFFRSKDEVLNSILAHSLSSLDTYSKMAKELEIRFFRIGNITCPHSDPDIQKAFSAILNKCNALEHETVHHNKHYLNVGMNYDREDDLLRAFIKMSASYVPLSQFSPKDILRFSDMGNQRYPVPDIYIRGASPNKGGRTGNFLPDMSETLLFFTKKYAPIFTMEDIFEGCSVFADPLAKYKSRDHFNTI